MRHSVLLVIFVLLFNAANANEYAAEVKHAETNVQNGEYILAADLDYHLSPQANEALQNGVPLFWTIKIKLQQQHDFWLNKTLLKKTLRYELQYHALLNMYRVRNENTGEVRNFSTLTTALNTMATVRDLPLIATKNLVADAHYLVAIKVFFDDDALPLPLQTQVIANSQWQLSSDWTQWSF
jgi:hypothetical protein